MALLDTSFLIDLLRGKREIFDIKDELDKSETILSVATPSVMELWAGALMAKCSEREITKINELLHSLNIIDFDEKSAKESAEIEAQLYSKGTPIETEDVMIAGIARSNREKVVTKDAHFTKIQNLKVLKY